MITYFCSVSFNRENNTDCKKDRSKLKIIAHQMLLTSKPDIKLSAIMMIIAFITSKKSPRVRMVIGRVKSTKIGFTIKLSKLNTMATITAVVKESTPTPGKICDKITTATALSKILRISFITLILNIKKVPNLALLKYDLFLI